LELDESKLLFDELLQIWNDDSLDSVGWFLIAHLNAEHYPGRDQDKIEEARQLLEDSIQRMEKDPEADRRFVIHQALEGLGDTPFELGRTDEAREKYTRVVEERIESGFKDIAMLRCMRMAAATFLPSQKMRAVQALIATRFEATEILGERHPFTEETTEILRQIAPHISWDHVWSGDLPCVLI
jgi:hypothetical protein